MYDTTRLYPITLFAIDFNVCPLQPGQSVHMFFLLLVLATRRNTFILGTDPLPDSLGPTSGVSGSSPRRNLEMDFMACRDKVIEDNVMFFFSFCLFLTSYLPI